MEHIPRIEPEIGSHQHRQRDPEQRQADKQLDETP
jgi:hypothetical protein